MPDSSSLSTFRIPSEATILEALPYGQHLLHGPTLVAHENTSRDFYVIIQTLSVLVPPDSECLDSRLRCGWTVDSISRLWPIAIARKDVIAGIALSHSYELLLKLLHKSVSSLSALRSERIACLLAGKLLCQVSVDILQVSIRNVERLPNHSLQMKLSWSIAHLFSSCKKVPGLLQVYYEHLEYWVTETLKRPNVLQAYCNDLQVRLRFALSRNLT